MLGLVKQWLKTPVEERDAEGKIRGVEARAARRAPRRAG